MRAKKKATARKATPKKKATAKKASAKKPADKPKPRTKKDLLELAKKLAHASKKLTQPQALDALAKIDKAKPGLPALELVTKASDDQVAAIVFGQKKPKQMQLPPPKATGEGLTIELSNLEMKLTRQKAHLADAEQDLKDAKKEKEDAADAVQKTFDAMADVVRDIRTRQGRIVFRDPETGCAKKNGVSPAKSTESSKPKASKSPSKTTAKSGSKSSGQAA